MMGVLLSQEMKAKGKKALDFNLQYILCSSSCGYFLLFMVQSCVILRFFLWSCVISYCAVLFYIMSINILSYLNQYCFILFCLILPYPITSYPISYQLVLSHQVYACLCFTLASTKLTWRRSMKPSGRLKVRPSVRRWITLKIIKFATSYFIDSGSVY